MDEPTTPSTDQDTGQSTGQSTRESATPGFYKVPRRFDLATVFVVTFVYAASFGMMNALEAPVVLTATVMGSLTLVGIVQMLVSERRARFASIVCGWVAMAVAYAIQYSSLRSPPTSGMLVSASCSSLILGALTGYICGTVVAGVFLVADYVRKAIRLIR